MFRTMASHIPSHYWINWKIFMKLGHMKSSKSFADQIKVLLVLFVGPNINFCIPSESWGILKILRIFAELTSFSFPNWTKRILWLLLYKLISISRCIPIDSWTLWKIFMILADLPSSRSFLNQILWKIFMMLTDIMSTRSFMDWKKWVLWLWLWDLIKRHCCILSHGWTFPTSSRPFPNWMKRIIWLWFGTWFDYKSPS